MKLAPALLFAALLLLGIARAGADELRFSVTLGAEERESAGLAKLTSDQVAVVDALIRRDTARGASTVSSAPTAADDNDAAASTFSGRLTPGERSTAGLATLSPAEIARLDAFVERYQGAKLARTLLAPPSYVTRSRTPVTEKKKEREIHGSFSLSFGFGSGGYSERSGSMVLTMEDPDKGYAISVGYTESRIKGGYGVYRDPYYDPLNRPLLPEDPQRP